MPDINHILQEGDELNDEQLLKYLQGSLTDEERHELEKQMAHSAFVNDAVEGLQQFDDQAQIQDYVQKLNKDLQKQTAKKKKRKAKRKLKDQDWIVMTVIIVIILCLLGYFTVKEFHKHSKLLQNQSNKQDFKKS
jgi:uncharacterized membrane protein YgcG